MFPPELNDLILICDDIQVGCSRTGTFFSFERAGIKPDMVVLSKSISGYGLPMSLLLIKKQFDIWKPAEHNGTFRGTHLAFVAAKEARDFNVENDLNDEVKRKAGIVDRFVKEHICCINDRITHRGLGLIWGIDLSKIDGINSEMIADKCFENGLIIERAGRQDSVLKILPPLVIEDEVLIEGLGIIKKSIEECIK